MNHYLDKIFFRWFLKSKFSSWLIKKIMWIKTVEEFQVQQISNIGNNTRTNVSDVVDNVEISTF
jgi:hypothetical protein